MRLTNKLLQQNVNLSKASPIGNFLKSLAGAMAILAVIYFGMVFTINAFVPYISPDAEQWIAKYFFMGQYDGGKRTNEERALQNKLDELVATAPHLPYSPTIHIVETTEVNAYALPGGTILMYRGLLDEVESENELAFIMSHEMGHLAHRDHLRGLGRALTITSINLVCTYVAGVSILPDVLTLYDRGVSRSQESAADLYGADRLHQRHGNISGSFAFFQRQRTKHLAPGWDAYFSTHPKDDKRILDLEEYAIKMGYPVTSPVPKG